ncbi:hypothetical protein ACG98H_12130 [Corynebacterium sp. L4756]|uniref:hypothetical protein n=1 Tax=unclassified Corynebacterium TaxID=2624378 RepID=UPI00374CE3EC
MKQSINRASTVLFALAMILFLILGFIIVFGQALGLIIQSGDIVSGAYNTFAQPSIALAITASLFGFIAFNTAEKKPVLEEDED